MFPLPGRCPVCASTTIAVTRIECSHCKSSVESRFSPPRLTRLTTEQLRFAEIFLLNEGKINRVEQEMGLSYTAVRARLEEIIEALGGQPAGEEQSAAVHRGESPVGTDKRREILARVSAGEISAAEAAALLQEKDV